MRYLIKTSILILLLTSCSDDNPEPEIAFEFELLNENGKPATTFKQGENFVFAFSIVNQGDVGVSFIQSSFDRTDFLRVLGTPRTGEDNHYQDFGKPYYGLFCFEQGGLGVPPNGKRTFQIPWQAPSDYTDEDGYFFCRGAEAKFLPQGDYFTEFTSDFSFFKQGEDLNEKFNVGRQHFQFDFFIH